MKKKSSIIKWIALGVVGLCFACVSFFRQKYVTRYTLSIKQASIY